MIEHIWSILGTKTIVDSETNNISIIEMIEELTVQNFTKPGIIQIDYEIVTSWFRENAKKEETIEYKINLVTPSGKDKGGPEVKNIFEPGIQRNRSRVILKSFPLEELGIHRFKIYLKGQKGKYKEVAFIPITVKEKES